MTDCFYQLGSFELQGRRVSGLVLDEEVFDLAEVANRAGIALPPVATLAELLDDWQPNLARCAQIAEFARGAGAEALGAVPVGQTRPLPPLGRLGKQIYAAANYRDHVAGMRKTFTPKFQQSDAQPPLEPYFFGKVCAPTGAYDDVVLPHGMQRIDWEAELMVVIGRAGRNVRPEEVKDHIAGYMTTNDLSCRDRTWRLDRPSLRSDWFGGKSWDSFAPMGPYFTPAVFMKDHADLNVRCWVNGELKQDGNTGAMIFSIEDQVAYISRMLTLLPGDVIATGTPAGTGQERLEYLKAGDVIEAEVEMCGKQVNRVVEGPAGYVEVRGKEAEILA